jgi:hypothetical protein
MKTSRIVHFLLIAMTAAVWTGCATTKVTTPNYVGRWNYELDTPQGRYAGWIIINQEGKEVTGTMNSEMGSVDLRDLKIEDNFMTANFNIMDMDMDLSGEFVEDVLNAKIIVQGYEMPFKANKVKE